MAQVTVFPAVGVTYMLHVWTTQGLLLLPSSRRVIDSCAGYATAHFSSERNGSMNLSGIGSILGLATQFLGTATPLGALGSLATSALGGSGSGSADASDPFAAILSLTKDVDGLASSGLGGGLLGSIAGILA